MKKVFISYDVTGYHPFFLQMLCYHLFERLDKPDWPSGQARDEALDAFERDSDPHFKFYWDVSEEQEKALIRKLAVGQPHDWSRLQPAAKSLEDRCLSLQTSGVAAEWRLFSSVFSKWVVNKQLSVVSPYVPPVDFVILTSSEDDTEEPIFKQSAKNFQQKYKPGISPGLLNRLKATLLSCGPFANDCELRSVFTDARISSWRDCLLTAQNPNSRVHATIELLFNKFSNTRENALVLLLHVLRDRTDPGDACYHHLTNLTIELEQEIQAGQAHPQRFDVSDDEPKVTKLDLLKVLYQIYIDDPGEKVNSELIRKNIGSSREHMNELILSLRELGLIEAVFAGDIALLRITAEGVDVLRE